MDPRTWDVLCGNARELKENWARQVIVLKERVEEKYREKMLRKYMSNLEKSP